MRSSGVLEETFPPEELAHLAAAPELVVGLDAALRMVFVNDVYEQRGFRDGGPGFLERWGLGDGYLEAISVLDVRGLFEEGLGAILRGEGPLDHDYECPRPDALERFHLHAMFAGPGLCLLTHTLVERSPAPPGPQDAGLERYRTSDGLLRQCAECRKVARSDGSGVWDWVPELLPSRPDVTHGLCPMCLVVYANT